MKIDFSFWFSLLDDTIVKDKDSLCDYLKGNPLIFDDEFVVSSVRAECYYVLCQIEDFYITETDNDKRISFFKIVSDNIEQIKADVSGSKILSEYSKCIIAEINKLESIIESRFSIPITSFIQPDSLNKETERMNIQIKWNLGVSTLCSMYYDMLYKVKIINSDKCLISSDPNDLVNFISNYFVDSEGDSFEIETIKDYILKGKDGNPKKYAKRDRVLIQIK